MTLELIWAFAGSLSAGIVFNVSRRNLFWTGLSGMLGWLVFGYITRLTGEVILPSFFGAVIIGLYSEITARAFKSPATVYTISGIFPIVPGIAAYNTIQYLMENKIPEAAAKAVETAGAAGAIAFGILLVTAVFRFARYRRLRKNPKASADT